MSPRDVTMPKTLPAVVAVAIIAFSIGFNTARYPIVWEMAGLSGRVPTESGDVGSTVAEQPAKADEVFASIVRDNPLRSQTAETQVRVESAGNAGPLKAQLTEDRTSPAMTELVPVPSELFSGGRWREGDQSVEVRRLPPIYDAVSAPAGRYMAEYPQSPQIIYPSTGIE
jgi:hypothetical protein